MADATQPDDGISNDSGEADFAVGCDHGSIDELFIDTLIRRYWTLELLSSVQKVRGIIFSLY
jgi:hypothetical protein